MKKLIVSILVIAMLAVATTPAFAEGGKPPDKPGNGNGHGYGSNKGNTPDVTETETPGKGHVKQAAKPEHKNGKMPGSSNFVLFGKLTKVDDAAKTIEVEVFSGNNLVQVFLGKAGSDEDTTENETVAPLTEGKPLTGIVVADGARIKVFKDGQVQWATLAELKTALGTNTEFLVRVHGWWKPAADATFTGKPVMADLEKGTWTAWQIFEMNPNPETEETETTTP